MLEEREKAGEEEENGEAGEVVEMKAGHRIRTNITPGRIEKIIMKVAIEVVVIDIKTIHVIFVVITHHIIKEIQITSKVGGIGIVKEEGSMMKGGGDIRRMSSYDRHKGNR